MPIKVVRIPKSTPNKQVRGGHAKPLKVHLDLSQPGRLRLGHLLTLYSVSCTTLYKGIKAGTYPPPDGRDGVRPYWNTETIRKFLGQ